MNRRAAIIYKSIHHGNTEEVARAMADEIDAELFVPRQVRPQESKCWNLIGFGSGIYLLKHHVSLLQLVQDMDLTGKRVFIFSTYSLGWPALYNARLRSKLVNCRAEIVGEFSCKGFDTFGPLSLIGGIFRGRPDERDLFRARRFVRSIISEE